MASELVPASKRLLGNDIPQGNTRLPRTQAVLSKHIPDQVKIYQLGLASDMFKTRWTHYGTWAQLGLKVRSAQDQRFDGNGIMHYTIRPGPKAQWAWDHSLYNSPPPPLIRVRLPRTYQGQSN